MSCQSVLDALEKVAVILASIATIAKVLHDWKKVTSNLDKEREGREPFLKFLVLIISHLKCYEEDFLSHPVLHGGFPCDPVSYRLGKCKRP